MAAEKRLANARSVRAVPVAQSQQRTSDMESGTQSQIRVRDNAEHGVETKPRKVKPITLSISEIYLKIGTHWSPIDGNAADQYGFKGLK